MPDRHGPHLPHSKGPWRLTVTNEVLSTDEEQIAPLDPAPCPITLAWSEKDSLFPVATYGQVARERLPQATFKLLPDVNHVPMIIPAHELPDRQRTLEYLETELGALRFTAAIARGAAITYDEALDSTTRALDVLLQRHEQAT